MVRGGRTDSRRGVCDDAGVGSRPNRGQSPTAGSGVWHYRGWGKFWEGNAPRALLLTRGVCISASVQENHVFARFSGFLWQLVSWFSCFLFIWGWGGAAVFSRKRPKNEVFRPDFGPHLGGGHAHPGQALV